MVQNATEESVKNEIPSKEDEMSVYDNFPEEEEEVTQEEVVEEDVGIPDAAAAEDSDDELVLLKVFIWTCWWLVESHLSGWFYVLPQNFGKVSVTYKWNFVCLWILFTYLVH